MIKKAYESIPMDAAYAVDNLKIGDYVVANKDMLNGAQTEVAIAKGAEFKVANLNFSDSKTPGMFILDIFGGWGFHFGKNGLGWNFDHINMNEEDELGMDFGEIPYKILNTLIDQKILTREDLITKVIDNSMMVPIREKKKVYNNIDDAILSMIKTKHLGVSERKSAGGGQMLYVTDKGIQLLGNN